VKKGGCAGGGDSKSTKAPLVTTSQSDKSPEMRKLTSKPIPPENEKANYSLSITDTLYALFDRAIQSKYSHLPDAPVLITNSKVADYQCNSAMSISQV
jgi:hypothetical protein